MRAYAGYFTYVAMKAHKGIDPTTFLGKSLEEIQNVLPVWLRGIRRPYFVSTDGSQHDASQSKAWLKAFDVPFAHKLMDFIEE